MASVADQQRTPFIMRGLAARELGTIDFAARWRIRTADWEKTESPCPPGHFADRRNTGFRGKSRLRLDRDFARFGFFCLRQRHGQDAVAILGLDLVLFHRCRQDD